MLVDSHCHLDFTDFADDLDGVMERAGEAGVGHVMSICTHVTRFDPVLAVAERFDNVTCTVGIHPHNAESEPEVTAEHLVRMADRPKVVGFGETGLDYHYSHSPHEVQRAQFLAHIAAGRQADLPLVIHTRDADDDMAFILKKQMGKGAFRGLLHCFSSSRELAEAALELGLYLSISGIVTFKAAEELRDIVRDIPLDRLLVETDGPYLAPIPMRGKRNEPAFTAYTAEKVAEIKGISLEKLAESTTENFFNLFTKAEAYR